MTIFKNNKNEFINCVDKNLKRLRSKNRSNQLKEEEILYELKKYNLKDAIKSIAIIYQSMYHNVKSKDIRVFACEHPSFPCLLRVDTLTKLTHLFIKSGTNDYKTKLISENLEAKSASQIAKAMQKYFQTQYNVGLLHGQMKEDEKEKVMNRHTEINL